ncbi:hypothetical protein D9M68_503640 [compost metagenome]
MGVAPRRQRRTLAQVLHADIVAADKRLAPVHDDQLAVVAEVELEAVDEAAMRGKRPRIDARIEQRAHVAARQRMAADAVEQEVDLDAGLRALAQQRLQAPAQRIVVHDEELHDQHLPGLADRGKDGIEGLGAVDQQAHVVIGQAWHAGQPRQRTHAELRRRVHHAGAAGLSFARSHAVADLAQPVVIEAARIDIAAKGAAPEDQVRDQREVRHHHQRPRPGDGAGRGAHRHDGVQRRHHADDVKGQEDEGDDTRALQHRWLESPDRNTMRAILAHRGPDVDAASHACLLFWHADGMTVPCGRQARGRPVVHRICGQLRLLRKPLWPLCPSGHQ